jgi:LacI family transcriptional regulator
MRCGQGYLDDLSAPPKWDRSVCDGVICHVGPERGICDWLKRGGVPVVNTTADLPPAEIPSVHSNHRSVARLAVRHLLELGCEHFAFFGSGHAPGAKMREQTLRKELKARGHRLLVYRHGLEYVWPQESLQVLGQEPKVGQFLTSVAKPLAVVAQNDYSAAILCQLCLHLGLAVPEEVAILGVDDSSLARYSTPRLSSIHTPGEEIGYRAMQLLDRLMHGGTAARRAVEVPATQIACRESTTRQTQGSADVRQALRLIRNEAHSGLRVSHIARALNVSRKTLERRFRDELGYSPGDAIRRVRMERAQELLTGTELSVTRIAQMVGFDRPSAFTTFFKQHAGRSPLEFRRQNTGAG